MNIDSVSITKLDHNEAKKFFLKNSSYISFDLPPYLNFELLLSNLSKQIGKKNLEDLYQDIDNNHPKDIENENINYRILFNKDGGYDWRPLQIIHPIFYVWIVNQITISKNWELIVSKIRDMRKSSKIQCRSIPQKSLDEKKDITLQIKKWINDVEKESVKLSMSYDHLLRTDIVDCYGSVYTHNISRAINGKKSAKDNHQKFNLGNNIDKAIRHMSHNQTNGIPQGSILMDFIVEIVFAYFDKNISIMLEKAKDEGRITDDYKIIRYRDDYRIFCNNITYGKEILKIISDILAGEGMRLNTDKTILSPNVIMTAIKEEKWYIKSNYFDQDLESILMNIYTYSSKYQNTGGVLTLLARFLIKLRHDIIDKKFSKPEIYFLIAIISDLEMNNPKAYSLTNAILSELISLFSDHKERREVIETIAKKLNRSINNELQQIWLQRLYFPIIEANETSELVIKSELAKVIRTKDTSAIWNSAWVRDEFKETIDNMSVVNIDKLNSLSNIMSDSEFNIFEY